MKMTEAPTGLNGPVFLSTPDPGLGRGVSGITLGSTPGEPYGYKRSLKVTIDLRVEQNPGAHESVEHETIVAPLGFSITANVWQPGGGDIVAAGRGDLLDNLDSHALGEDVTEFLRGAAAEWHLNAIHAGCVHQDPQVPENVSPLDRTGWLLDNTPACPVTGYRYGSKWLVKPLTDTFLRDLLRHLTGPIESRHIYVEPNFPGLVGMTGGSA